MYRIRFHGRGGQGIKTAGRILGTAFFLEGFEVQDAPRYGAERRGAPLFAYVRAARRPINERGIITAPDLIIVADDSLVPLPAAGVLPGAQPHTVLLLNTAEAAATWQERLHFPGSIVTVGAAGEGADGAVPRQSGVVCAGAASRLLGVISLPSLRQAVREELAPLGEQVVEQNLAIAVAAYEGMTGSAGCVAEGNGVPASSYRPPAWVDVPFEDARVSAPAIHGAATSVEVRTGLWRTLRPVLDRTRCRRCWWICTTFCPDSVMRPDSDGCPEIDYDHCKGCMVCAAQCHNHAIEAVPERSARSGAAAGGRP